MAKSSARIGVLKTSQRPRRRGCVFFCLPVSARKCQIVMVGWAGAPSGAPVTLWTGYANLVQFTPIRLASFGGDPQIK
ncbi:hypothetical protein C4K68_07640 [Pokkaliibacter plantistimulans]|uniref:Uncharacterized protein n=1 Tax=Proteobacteria bacterium 228 TaxID=2083153 RepID=A0A2S5KTQ6_9PROT|nr:hypothetical protein C4K68_07640 [Pokkaliibacter plantistimulans]